MSPTAAATLRAVRRGDDGGELHLIDSEGRVAILFAHGIHDDERARVREEALRLICTVLPPDPLAEDPLMPAALAAGRASVSNRRLR